MKIENIQKGDTLVSTDCNGTGYYRVRKVCRVKVRVLAENGNELLAYPNLFDRKVNYSVKAFDAESPSQ